MVVNYEDYDHVSVFCDYSEVLKNLDLPTALCAMITLHFVAFIEYASEAQNLKTYVQESSSLECALTPGICQERS